MPALPGMYKLQRPDRDVISITAGVNRRMYQPLSRAGFFIFFVFIHPGFRSHAVENDHKPLYHKALPFQGGCMFLSRNPGRRRKRLCPGLLCVGLSGRKKSVVTSESGLKNTRRSFFRVRLGAGSVSGSVKDRFGQE